MYFVEITNRPDRHRRNDKSPNSELWAERVFLATTRVLFTRSTSLFKLIHHGKTAKSHIMMRAVNSWVTPDSGIHVMHAKFNDAQWRTYPILKSFQLSLSNSCVVSRGESHSRKYRHLGVKKKSEAPPTSVGIRSSGVSLPDFITRKHWLGSITRAEFNSKPFHPSTSHDGCNFGLRSDYRFFVMSLT